jgi:hypothetical protein
MDSKIFKTTHQIDHMSSLLFLPKAVANDGTLQTVAIDVEVSFD